MKKKHINKGRLKLLEFSCRCDICGKLRQDNCINTLTMDLEIEGKVIPNATRNVHYCKDNPQCRRGAFGLLPRTLA